MARTRILLAAMPTMLTDIVRETLAPHLDLEIVAELVARDELMALLATTPVEVAIVGLAAAESPVCCAELLRAYPHLTVIAITADGRTAYHCEMRLQVSVMTELSAQGLLAALRAPGGVDRALHLFSVHRTISATEPLSDH